MGELNLKGKVAVVTGASQGLGEALAIRLDKEGCKVAVCDFNIEGAKAVAAKLKDAIAIPVDVTNYEQCEAMAKTVLDKWGQVDILVSNAGIVKSGDIYNLTPAMFAAVTNVNLNGYFNVVKAFAPSMLERKSGSIIQINSKSGRKGSFKNGAYAASKFGGVGYKHVVDLASCATDDAVAAVLDAARSREALASEAARARVTADEKLDVARDALAASLGGLLNR